LKQNKNKNKNKLLIEIKKTKLRQVVFKLIANLNWTNLKDSFARFYNFKIKSLCNFESLTKLLNKNIIKFYFYFVCALFAYIFLKNKKNENIYR